jgi:hypothetical protein
MGLFRRARSGAALRNDASIEGDVCGERHRDSSSVVGVRRP